MRDLNKTLLTGRLGHDPQFRVTSDGRSVATLSVASNHPVKQPDGSWQDQGEWFRVVVWGRWAERAAAYLTKGSRVFIERRFQTRAYIDGNGNERSSTEVIASDLIMLDAKNSSLNSEELPFAPSGSPESVEELEPQDLPF